MVKFFIVIGVIFLSWSKCADAAENISDNAKKRAANYQAEVRAALLKHQWHVAGESVGILVADHTLLDQEASINAVNGQSGYTRAVLKFKPKSATDTACAASVLNYVDGYYLTADLKKYHGRPPTASSPDTVKAVEKIINDARSRLIETHPEYGNANPH